MHYEKFHDGTVKCIEDEIPFKVPEGWVWTRLGCITDIIQYGLSNAAEASGNYRLLRITDIQDGNVNWNAVPFTSTDEPEKYLLRKDDIVFARTGATVGKSFLIIDLPYASVYASYLIRIRIIRGISSNYVYQFFNSYCYWNQITDKAVGVGQPNCNGTSLRELLIPLPSEKEQNRIVPIANNFLKIIDIISSEREKLSTILQTTKCKILDLAIRGKLVPQDPNDEPASVLLERIHEEKEELIKQGKIKRNKKESVIFRGDDNSYYEIVDGTKECINDDIPFELPANWEWTRLSNIVQILNGDRGQNYPAKNKLQDTGIPFVSASDIDLGVVVSSNLLCMTEEQYNSLSAGKLITGDIVYCIRGSLGKCGIFTLKKGAIASSLVIVRPIINDPVVSNYIFNYLNSEFSKNEITKYNNGSAQPNLAAKDFMRFLVPIPPLREQDFINNKLLQIRQYIEQIEKNTL